MRLAVVAALTTALSFPSVAATTEDMAEIKAEAQKKYAKVYNHFVGACFDVIVKGMETGDIPLSTPDDVLDALLYVCVGKSSIKLGEVVVEKRKQDERNSKEIVKAIKRKGISM